MNRDWLAGLGIVILYLLMVGRAAAQSDRGTIAGSVLDSTGAVVAGASITITGVDTGNTYKTVSTSEGVYRVADIQTGRYNITVQAPGFKVSQQHGVLIQISTTTALNITLEPGNVQEEVTVLADAPTLQTESSDIGTVVGDKQIRDLPVALNATGQSFVRSPETFVFLTREPPAPAPIATTLPPESTSRSYLEDEFRCGSPAGWRQHAAFRFGYCIRPDRAYGRSTHRVQSHHFKPSAQYGHTSGGIESFTTKSGSNGYHGSIFELFRNEALDANPWSNDFANAKIEQTNVGCNPVTDNPPCTALNRKPRDRQNDFGGSLGGPVRILISTTATTKLSSFSRGSNIAIGALWRTIL